MTRLAAVPSWCAPRLRIVTPEGAATKAMWVDLPPGDSEVTMGRAETSTIRLSDPWASRRHATLSMRGGRLVLADLGSRWGTRLNAAELKGPHTVADGDAIVIGATSIVVEHAWRGSATERLPPVAGQERSDDGLMLFDSASRRLPAASDPSDRGRIAAWEQWIGLAATVLLAAGAALLAWRLLAGD